MWGKTARGGVVAKPPKISLSPGPIQKYMSQKEPLKSKQQGTGGKQSKVN